MWSNAALSRLIKEFKNRPALWDDGHKRFGDSAHSSALIREIADTLTREFAHGYTEGEVRMQWNRLKSKLILYITKLNCWAKNSDLESEVPTFEYARQMDFLMDDDSIVTFRNKSRAMYQCSICGGFFSSPKQMRMHKTVKCPADDCDWEGDSFNQHLRLQHPYMSLASLLKSFGSFVSLRCVLLSMEKTVSESTPQYLTSPSSSGLSLYATGTVVEKGDEAMYLEPNTSVDMTAAVGTNYSAQHMFSCPLNGCFFESNDFDHFNAHLVGRHSDVFRVGTAIEVVGSCDDGSVNNECLDTVNLNVAEVVRLDNQSPAVAATNESNTFANGAIVEHLKMHYFFDKSDCSESKGALMTERRLMNGTDATNGDEIVRNNSSFEVVVPKTDTYASDDSRETTLTSFVNVPNEITVERESSSTSAVASVTNKDVNEGSIQINDDLPATSTSNSQTTRTDLEVESISSSGEAVAAEMLMEESSVSPEDGRSLDEDDDDEEDDLTNCKYHPLMHHQRNAALWLKRHRLIASSMRCSSCVEPLRWTYDERCSDCFVWKCGNVICDRCDEHVSIRSGSIFDDRRLTLGWYIEVMRLWSIGLNVRKAVKQSGIPAAPLIDAYRRFRRVCVEYIRKNPLPIGGSYSDCYAIIVPIILKCAIESHKMYIMIIVDLNSNPKMLHLEAITDVGAESMMRVIRRVVIPGTKIHCDQSVSLKALIEFNDKQHSLQSGRFYFDESQLKNTEKIDELRLLFHKLKRELIDVYRLCGFANRDGADWEYLWRHRFGEDAFLNLCHHIIV
ncbi:unnamed protein product [Toxocara canis]|uniref:MADF domain-containing protein n=1 Tax=Toxocara canis TaxID=6265 RepID=A0A183V6U4_TOXCA|nr:unnamed protein product [Toxocara canis]